jgi:hypothetical protein
MKSDLQRGYMRIFQFVKTFVEPSVDMLFENFIRGSGIYCRENQKAVDSIVPIGYPGCPVSRTTESAQVKKTCPDPTLEQCESSDKLPTADPAKRLMFIADKMGAFLIQVKLRKRYETPKQKESWLESIPTLDVLKEISALSNPCIALFLELGWSDFNGIGGPEPKKARESLFEVVETDFGYAIFVRINRLSEIDMGLITADGAFGRLLESLIDPADSSRIPEENRPAIRRMFKTQPYMIKKKTP